MNERYSGSHSGSAFGEGVYLAEDVGKTDQYSSIDAKYDPRSELHRRLYDDYSPHAGDVYYVLVCRCLLGFPAITTEIGKHATHRRTAKPLFPVSFRELASIPSVLPPMHYNALIVEQGGALARFREFVIFHGEQICPVYLLAYTRGTDPRGRS